MAAAPLPMYSNTITDVAEAARTESALLRAE
jgi:hypothetical protein